MLLRIPPAWAPLGTFQPAAEIRMLIPENTSNNSGVVGVRGVDEQHRRGISHHFSCCIVSTENEQIINGTEKQIVAVRSAL